MFDDIVTRLSDAQAECDLSPCDCQCYLHQDAIDEIVRLRAEVARLNTFLHPIGIVINKEVRGE